MGERGGNCDCPVSAGFEIGRLCERSGRTCGEHLYVKLLHWLDRVWVIDRGCNNAMMWLLEAWVRPPLPMEAHQIVRWPTQKRA
ncbi:hypothetical protein GGR40_003783 [Novosphingobium gossypii]